MKILVPIDGSTYSENSLAFVASRTSLLGHSPEIELLVVLDPLPARAARLVGKDSLMRYYEEEAEKIFAPARKFLVGHNIHVNEAFIVGDPAEKISEEATRLNVDLIIMGSRGRTALAGLFLGSVTNGVLARTKNPILIVRNKNAPDRDGMRVGVCVDGSKYGSAAVKYAIRNAVAECTCEAPVSYGNEQAKRKVVLWDFGAKENIVREPLLTRSAYSAINVSLP